MSRRRRTEDRGVGELQVDYRHGLPRIWVGENVDGARVVHGKEETISPVAVLRDQLNQFEAVTGHGLPSGVLFAVDGIPLGQEASPMELRNSVEIATRFVERHAGEGTTRHTSGRDQLPRSFTFVGRRSLGDCGLHNIFNAIEGKALEKPRS